MSADPDSLWKPHQREHVPQIHALSPAALNNSGTLKQCRKTAREKSTLASVETGSKPSCTRCPCPVFPEKSSYQAGLSSIVPNIPVFLWTVLFPRSEERSVPLWWWICSYWEQKLNQQVKETAFIGFVWNVTTSFMICLTSIWTELEMRTADILYLPVHKNVVHKSWSWTLKLKKYNACRCCDAQKLK